MGAGSNESDRGEARGSSNSNATPLLIEGEVGDDVRISGGGVFFGVPSTGESEPDSLDSVGEDDKRGETGLRCEKDGAGFSW